MRYYFCLIIASLLCSHWAFAQEEALPFKVKHSFEISTGFPYVWSMMHPPGDLDNSQTKMAEEQGMKLKSLFPLNLSVSYALKFAPRWEACVRANTRGWIYKRFSDSNSSLGNEIRGISASLFVRYYWIQNESTQWYSSLGIGNNFYERYNSVEPDIIPIGLHWGKKKMYGIAELSYGTAGTVLVFGMGIRLN